MLQDISTNHASLSGNPSFTIIYSKVELDDDRETYSTRLAIARLAGVEAGMLSEILHSRQNVSHRQSLASQVHRLSPDFPLPRQRGASPTWAGSSLVLLSRYAMGSRRACLVVPLL
jgi:hypothetical protein